MPGILPGSLLDLIGAVVPLTFKRLVFTQRRKGRNDIEDIQTLGARLTGAWSVPDTCLILRCVRRGLA
jgi:hypothetical protein